MIELSESIKLKIAVVIPSFKVTQHILEVINNIQSDVDEIYIIDDACPDGSGKLVEDTVSDSRVRIIFHKKNMGVGGAVITGYQAALENGADIIIKIDGDGQMDPRLIPYFIEPIISGKADYTKGNRFFDLEGVRSMPTLRLIGNAILSFMTKLSSGYWNLFDPTNGYTAIHTRVLNRIPLTKISFRYFFETDMLFRLNTMHAVIIDIPMESKYDDEKSNLKITSIILEFFLKHLIIFSKRLFYNYYLRNLSIASIELPLGLVLFSYGTFFGIYNWIVSSGKGIATPVGTIMLSVLPILMGLQFVMAFLSFDISSVPSVPVHTKLSHSKLH